MSNLIFNIDRKPEINNFSAPLDISQLPIRGLIWGLVWGLNRDK